MPTNSKNNKTKQRNQRKSTPRKKRQPRRTARAGTGFPTAAQTMLNPCSASPITGIYGTHEGLGARFHSSVTDASSVNTSGFILWCPNFTPDVTHSTLLTNLVGSCTANPATAQVNTTGAPAYLNTGFINGDTTFYLPDPAQTFATGTLSADARVTGACMQMRSIGKLLNLQGEIAYITNLPNDELVRADQAVPSVNRLFDYSTKISRISDSHVEIKFQLDEDSHTFNDHYTAPFVRGVVASHPSNSTSNSRAHEPTWFGFAWRGLDAAVEKANVFDFYKIVEWRPSPLSGLTQIPKQVIGPSLVRSALTRAAKIDPEWWAKHVGTVFNVGRRLASSRSGQFLLKN